MIKNYLSHFLPVLLALDLIIPFLLAPFYKDYNHLTQVMSVLSHINKIPGHEAAHGGRRRCPYRHDPCTAAFRAVRLR